MIKNNPARKANLWQQSLIDCVTDVDELFQLLELDQLDQPPELHHRLAMTEIKKACQTFGLKVPRSFIKRMKKRNLQDPLLLQVLPLGVELNKVSGYVIDPLSERSVNPIPGLLHKYHGRVLLTFTSACGIHCRYCFRRNFNYADNNPGREGWIKTFAYINHDPTISEVILSGGDPLVANDVYLADFVNQLQQIPHVKRLRIHTRMPIVIPERVTKELLAAITSTRLQTIVVVHCNHPQEMDESVNDALLQLQNLDRETSEGTCSATKSKITVFNQTVLLKDINDSVDVLVELSEKLFKVGVIPYYLHLLDKVDGVAHFDLPLATAKQLYQELSAKLPGYLLPKLVCEQAGELSKVQV